MNEQTKRFIAGCIACIVIMLSITSCVRTKWELAADMVNNGASPLEVKYTVYEDRRCIAVFEAEEDNLLTVEEVEELRVAEYKEEA